MEGNDRTAPRNREEAPGSEPGPGGPNQPSPARGEADMARTRAENGTEKQHEEAQGKGKGREKDTIPGRLRASAMLAVNAAKTPPQAPSAGKAMPGVPDTAARAHLELGETSRRAASTPETGEAAGGSIRRAPDSEAATRAFDDFINDSHLPSVAGDRDSQGPTAGYGGWGSMAEQEAGDGRAVVHLLSQPDDDDDELDERQDEMDLLPPEAAKLRAALFETVGTRAISWNDLLNFTPDFLADPGSHPEASTETDLHLGVAEASAAQDLWLQQWGEVLSSYTDQVWGDLGPLAARAKEEVDELATSSPGRGRPHGEEIKALNRLRQILAHVRGGH